MGGGLIWTFSIVKPSIQSMFFYPIGTFQHYLHMFPRIVESGKIWGQLMGLAFFVIGIVHFYFSVRPITFSGVDNSYSKGFWKKKRYNFIKYMPFKLSPILVEGVIKRTEQYGGKARMDVMRYHPEDENKPYKMVYLEDPFGNLFELYSHSYAETYSSEYE